MDWLWEKLSSMVLSMNDYGKLIVILWTFGSFCCKTVSNLGGELLGEGANEG